MNSFTNKELHYIAGIIDGEGTISIYKISNKTIKWGYQLIPILVISNTNLELMNWLKSRIESGQTLSAIQQGIHRKVIYQFRVQRQKLLIVF